MLTSQKKRDHVKMIKDKYLNIEKLVSDKKIFRLFRAVESHGGVLRFVGGAVRNALRGMGGSDLDLATDLSPDELVEACQESGLKTVPIGIKFGTVGVVINGKVLEVTSLRKDVKSDGRHSEVEFTTDWEIDASRRDLTINAVYADETFMPTKKAMYLIITTEFRIWKTELCALSAAQPCALRKIICGFYASSVFIPCSEKAKLIRKHSRLVWKIKRDCANFQLSESAMN